MRRLIAVAATSLIGLIVAVILYGRYPLPTGTFDLISLAFYASLALLVVGLLCFIALLISGLILLLNWGARRQNARDERPR